MAPKSMLSAHFTPTTFLYFLFFFSLSKPVWGLNLNITEILSHYPDLSIFTALLTSTGISADLDRRTSLTILAVPNSHLRSSSTASPTILADVLRCHVLLQYLTWSDLRRTPPAGALVTNLFQTTGRAPTNLGSLNITFDPPSGVVSLHPLNNNTVSANVLSLLKTVPYNLSIFTVDSLLAPYGFDLMASEAAPPSPPLNITRALIDGHNFNVAAAMLTASGVVEEFEADEGGAGITLFVPTDEAFANLPPTVQLQALPAEKKSLVLKFHVLHSYYPLGSLESIVNPVQPTLATEDNGAGSFTLNISRVNGSVAINTGIVQAVVTQTVIDENPVAIFGVSRVLLPREIFGKDVDVNLGSGSGPFVDAKPPEVGVASPEEGYAGPNSHLGEISRGLRWRGGGALNPRRSWGLVVLCIGILLYV